MAEKTCTVHKLVADVTALGRGKVVLVRYADTRKYDNQAGWFLPDDYLAHGEHPEEAARRILKEQVGIAVDRVRLSHIESFGDGAWHLIFHYVTDLAGTPALEKGDNVSDAAWFPVKKLPSRKDVSHGGWAIDVLEQVLAGR